MLHPEDEEHMIQLTKNMIRNLASSEKTFMRGMQYFQNGRIQNASYSKASKRYKVIVKGNYNYTVMIEEQEDGPRSVRMESMD